jgi:hypothetical protein
MVEGASAQLGETDRAGVAVTTVVTMALAMARASTATTMVSTVLRGSTLDAEASPLAVWVTSWLESPAAQLEMIGTMVKGSTSMGISELILDSSIKVLTSIITIIKEVTSNIILGIMGTIVLMPTIDMGNIGVKVIQGG